VALEGNGDTQAVSWTADSTGSSHHSGTAKFEVVVELLEYTIDREQRLIAITGAYANATAWLLLMGQLRRDPQLIPHCGVLCDVRSASCPPTAATLRATFNVLGRFWPEIKPRKLAFVTDIGDPTPILVCALAVEHGLRLDVFTSLDAALEWLG
jgi:hypothetical protein